MLLVLVMLMRDEEGRKKVASKVIHTTNQCTSKTPNAVPTPAITPRFSSNLSMKLELQAWREEGREGGRERGKQYTLSQHSTLAIIVTPRYRLCMTANVNHYNPQARPSSIICREYGLGMRPSHVTYLCPYKLHSGIHGLAVIAEHSKWSTPRTVLHVALTRLGKHAGFVVENCVNPVISCTVATALELGKK